MLPAISLLTKISNHLELIRPDSKLEQQDKRQVGGGTCALGADGRFRKVHMSAAGWRVGVCFL
jgi:hypothetical protein